MKDYIPFSEEWKAQIMGMNKSDIVELYRTVCMKLKKHESTISNFSNWISDNLEEEKP